ncbi:hypothetical protein IEQ34_013780 [Dendrobium chrysotoxum]|uniref:THO1-MOS11 C-terminal domain-containing protein n=2 Tax=Dendrobium TaxID=37818 RepID=A0AAV7GT85_DENCH|nr:hypothetical protein IEQ34_013780 [Dendrobium chrysotoxum]
MYKLVAKFSSHQLTSLFKHFSTISQPLSGSATIYIGKYLNLELKNIEKALEILDFVTPGKSKVQEDQRHLRLIESCLHDLKVGQQNHSKFIESNAGGKYAAPVGFMYHNNIFDNFFTFWGSNNSKIEDLVLSFISLHRKGISPDESTLSCLFSSCGDWDALGEGVQLHALAVKIVISESCLVGTSLISLYSKCQQLESANQIFLNMPMRNTISWTAIIAGHAQQCQHEACLNLFNLMRKSSSKPNDFTCATILSTCRSNASLALGRSFHCLELQMGFDSYTHVLNALISMYSKCGNIEAARNIFDKISCRDIISWNSMIFGYSQYGLAKEAICLLKEMDQQITAPDKISFLGVLSSCRHAGLVKDGWDCYISMLKHGIEPGLDHYSCIVDLLGRAGLLEEALDFIHKMSVPPSGVLWGSLLSSCRVHGNVQIGIHAAERRLLLDPGCTGTHQQLANLYASVGRWDQVARVRKQMKEKGLKPNPAYSWIEIANKVYSFMSEDGSNSQLTDILDILDSLIVTFQEDAVQANKFMAEKSLDSSTSPSEVAAPETTRPASSLEKKIRRAERFGVPVQLSEEEKRNSRAERFGTNSPSPGKDVGVSEEQKRKARAERFGLVQHSSTDEAAKKKARLERFSQKPKSNALEEEKSKARAARFSGTSNSSSESNVKTAATVETGGGT